MQQDNHKDSWKGKLWVIFLGWPFFVGFLLNEISFKTPNILNWFQIVLLLISLLIWVVFLIRYILKALE